MHRRSPLLIALAASVLVLGGCGDDDDGSGGAGASKPVEDAQPVAVVADDFRFEPSEITIATGEDLAVALSSEDAHHDLTIDELEFQVAADRGDEEVGGLRVDEPGTYTFYCSVPGHRSAGMEGTLTVE